MKQNKHPGSLWRLCPEFPPLSGSKVGAEGRGSRAGLQTPLCRCAIPNMSLTGVSDLPNQRKDLRPRAPPGGGGGPPIAS